MQKQYRLTDRNDFKRVYRKGKSTANYQFVLYYDDRGDEGPFRLGVSVSKKIGNAVVRNRMRRRVKEIVRREAERIRDGYDLILIVRKGALQLDHPSMEKSIFHLLKKASLIR